MLGWEREGERERRREPASSTSLALLASDDRLEMATYGTSLKFQDSMMTRDLRCREEGRKEVELAPTSPFPSPSAHVLLSHLSPFPRPNLFRLAAYNPPSFHVSSLPTRQLRTNPTETIREGKEGNLANEIFDWRLPWVEGCEWWLSWLKGMELEVVYFDFFPSMKRTWRWTEGR